jgi:hypothetical protein
MTPDDLSDAALLTATVAGDTTAFDRFVTRHAAHVHRFLASLGVLDADADDVHAGHLRGRVARCGHLSRRRQRACVAVHDRAQRRASQRATPRGRARSFRAARGGIDSLDAIARSRRLGQ